jgi:hypothetical protein
MECLGLERRVHGKYVAESACLSRSPREVRCRVCLPFMIRRSWISRLSCTTTRKDNNRALPVELPFRNKVLLPGAIVWIRCTNPNRWARYSEFSEMYRTVPLLCNPSTVEAVQLYQISEFRRLLSFLSFCHQYIGRFQSIYELTMLFSNSLLEIVLIHDN